MTNKIMVAISVLTLSTAIVTVAQARDGFYLAVRGGLTNPNMNAVDDKITDKAAVDFDDVWMVGGAFGYRWGYLRTELEYTYRDEYSDRQEYGNTGTFRDAALEAESYMANAYIDFMPDYIISPFISGGIGYTNLKLSTKTTGRQARSWDESNLTWSLGGGLSLRLNKCLNLDMGYRYLDMGEIEEANMNAHEYYAGLRYTF